MHPLHPTPPPPWIHFVAERVFQTKKKKELAEEFHKPIIEKFKKEKYTHLL